MREMRADNKNLGRDLYDMDSLKEELKALGYEPRYFPETKSTMLIVDEFAKTHEKQAFVAIADHHTQGIGREGRIWYDISYCSVMFSTLFHIRESSIATFADLVALQTCLALKESTSSDSIKIKYPNDLVINDKKLGGILVKNIYDENFKYCGTNVGVGINVHYTKEELQKFKTDYPATSLDLAVDSFTKRQDILIAILKFLRYLDTEVDVILANPHASKPFEEKWRQASSLLQKQIVVLKQGQPLYAGRVIDTKLGEGIQIQTEEGQVWVSLFESDMKVRMKDNVN